MKTQNEIRKKIAFIMPSKRIKLLAINLTRNVKLTF